MITITLSSKFQVTIPQSVRRALNLSPGDRLHVLPYAGRITLIRARPLKSMRGFLKGIDTSFERDADRV